MSWPTYQRCLVADGIFYASLGASDWPIDRGEEVGEESEGKVEEKVEGHVEEKVEAEVEEVIGEGLDVSTRWINAVIGANRKSV